MIGGIVECLLNSQFRQYAINRKIESNQCMARGGKRTGAGRKPGFAAKAAEAARKYIAGRLKKEQKPIIDKAIEQATAGDFHARDFLYERGHGKVAQPISGDPENRTPIPILHVLSNNGDPKGQQA